MTDSQLQAALVDILSRMYVLPTLLLVDPDKIRCRTVENYLELAGVGAAPDLASLSVAC